MRHNKLVKVEFSNWIERFLQLPIIFSFFTGDKCLAVNPEDDLEYEGIIEHIINSGEGMIATIKAVGSEKAFTAWVDSLIPSREASPASFSQATISQGIIVMT